MSKPRKAAIYARVSTTDQDPDAQLLALCEDIYRIVAIPQSGIVGADLESSWQG